MFFNQLLDNWAGSAYYSGIMPDIAETEPGLNPLLTAAGFGSYGVGASGRNRRRRVKAQKAKKERSKRVTKMAEAIRAGEPDTIAPLAPPEPAVLVKRGPGRPRKHPLPVIPPQDPDVSVLEAGRLAATVPLGGLGKITVAGLTPLAGPTTLTPVTQPVTVAIPTLVTRGTVQTRTRPGNLPVGRTTTIPAATVPAVQAPLFGFLLRNR